MHKKIARLRRAKSTRSHIRNLGVPRLSVLRTGQHLYAQLFSADGAKVLAVGLDRAGRRADGLKNGKNTEAAAKVGRAIAEKAKAAASRRSLSTAPATATTAASRRWPMPRAKAACSSELTAGCRRSTRRCGCIGRVADSRAVGAPDSSTTISGDAANHFQITEIEMAEERRTAVGRDRNREEIDDGMIEKLIAVNRVSKTVKGGRQFTFTALTVVGDGNGRSASATARRAKCRSRSRSRWSTRARAMSTST